MLHYSKWDGTTERTMQQDFLLTLLDAVIDITRAERAMAVDESLQVLHTVKLKETELQEARFQTIATQSMRSALENGLPLVTNNIIPDIKDAPDTNTNFSDLRVVVVIPVQGYGALYLDQHIRYGMIPYDMINRTMRMIEQVINVPHDHFTADDLVNLYQQMI